MDLLQAFVDFMDQTSAAEVLLFSVMVALGSPIMLLTHEIGHSVAARCVGAGASELVVEGPPHLLLRAGRFTMRLSLTPRGGSVLLRGTTPLQLLVAASGGPLATLLMSVASAALVPSAHGFIKLGVAGFALENLLLAGRNLIPGGAADGALSDGALIRLAWRHRGGRLPPPPAVKRSRPSVPPPSAVAPPAPVGPPQPALRRPFAVLLGVIVLLAVITGAWLALLGMVILFGTAHLGTTGDRPT